MEFPLKLKAVEDQEIQKVKSFERILHREKEMN
jgi:hypothetical protein